MLCGFLWSTVFYVARLRYRLRSAEGDELGEFTTFVPKWNAGDAFTSDNGWRFRILRVASADDVDASGYDAIWEVEAAED
jgi:hypothetical protein